MVSLSEIDLYFPHLPQGLDGVVLLHIGDLHTRGFGTKEQCVQQVIDRGADMIFCSGDFCFQMGISNPLVRTAKLHTHDVGFGWRGFSMPPDIPMAKKVVSQLFEKVSCPLGIYAVQGNHDPDAFMPHLADLGIRVLANETIQVETDRSMRFNLFGVRCFERGFVDIPATLSNMDPDLFTIGSCHYPEMAESLAAAGVDLNLAGHTHAGQICLPGGMPIITHNLTGKKYVSGLNRIGTRCVYTTRGIGYSMLPLRFCCSSEIIRFTLKRGPSSQTNQTTTPIH